MITMSKYPKRTDREIKDLALGVYKREIFTSAQIEKGYENMLHLIFMPLVFMKQEQIDEMQEHGVFLFYANMSDACPSSCNGYPSFLSMGYLDKDDAERMWDKYEAIKKAIDGEMGKLPEGQIEIDFSKKDKEG